MSELPEIQHTNPDGTVVTIYCHPSARIGASARIGESASIGASARIGALARIGESASIGASARIGASASIGELARIGPRASIGAWAIIGASAIIGELARIGELASIGELARIGPRASIGASASIGARGQLVACLGDTGHGYTVCAYWSASTGLRITAGCRDFTLSEARLHWGDSGYDAKRGARIIALIDAGEGIAKIYGFSIEPSEVAA